MTRYARGHKRESKKRIVDAASALFRRDGVESVGIAAIMQAADLTHGGFYAHFPSKEGLLREGIRTASEASIKKHELAAAGAPAGNGLKALVTRYLSGSHRDRPEAGCVIAALGPEIARHPMATRSTLTRGIRDMLALLSRYAGASKRDAAAIQVLATLVGALQLARAVDDPALSEAFLREGRRAALALGSGSLDVETP